MKALEPFHNFSFIKFFTQDDFISSRIIKKKLKKYVSLLRKIISIFFFSKKREKEVEKKELEIELNRSQRALKTE